MESPPLIHLTLERGAFTCKRYRARYWDDLRRRTIVQHYETAHHRTEWPRGVYLFTGTDGLERVQMNMAKALYDCLSNREGECAVLNQPGRTLRRYDLLKKLRQLDINDFDVHRVDEVPPDVRFPCFVRYERFHRPNLTGLLRSRSELDEAIARLLVRGERADELIVVEHIDYVSDDGYYWKWGGEKVGSLQFGKHLMASRDWRVKRKNTDLRAVKGVEWDYIDNFPHQDLLEPIYDVSGHGWARMDYSFYKGRVQVWEINDNPEMGTKWYRTLGRTVVQERVFANFNKGLEQVASNIEPGLGMSFHIPLASVL